MQVGIQPRVSNRAASVLASGTIVWAFLIAIPTAHLGLLRHYGPVDMLLALLPLVVLAAGAINERPVLSLLLFLCAPLPLLIRFEVLTGPRVYGPGAFVALAAATVAHILVTIGPARRGHALRLGGNGRTRILGAHTAAFALLGLLPLMALHFDRDIGRVLDTAYAGYDARARAWLTLLFTAVWLLAVRRYLAGGLTDALLNRAGRRSEWYRFRNQATDDRRSLSNLLWALLVAGLAGILLAAVVSKTR